MTKEEKEICKLATKKVNVKKLFNHAENSPFTGSTENVKSRLSQHKKNYDGVMLYASTTNMEKLENKLLDNYIFEDNIQRESNADPIPGFVYVIDTTICLDQKTNKITKR